MTILVSVITGGRPEVSQRPTASLLKSLEEHGFSDFEWTVREDQAGDYESDGYPLNTYSVEWANDYARKHWRHPRAELVDGGFHGAFTGREWAMQSAEERGFSSVLQLDDNVLKMGIMSANLKASLGFPPGKLMKVLQGFAESTNSYMTGAQLGSIMPHDKVRTIRPGFPYSVFIEKTGPGRMPWYGPFEDDIMHAMEYGLNGGPARTAAVMDAIRYVKESKSKTGMRAKYDATRGLELVKRYPKNASLRMGPKTSSPKEKERGVRHYLRTTGFTPVMIKDREKYEASAAELKEMIEVYKAESVRYNQEKIKKFAGGSDE